MQQSPRYGVTRTLGICYLFSWSASEVLKIPAAPSNASRRSAFKGSDMPAKSLPTQTIRKIITVRSLSHLSYRELSALFGVSRTSVGTHLRAFERSSLTLGMTRRLSDETFLGRLLPTSARQQSYRQDTLLALFPRIHQGLSDPTTSLLDEWKSYKRQHPRGLGYSRFCQLYDQWLSASGLTKWPQKRWTVPIALDDCKALKTWRSSNDKRKWQHAVALLDLHRHCTIASICRKLERSPKTIKRWRRMFVTHGLAGLALPSKKAVNQGRITRSTFSALDLLSPTPARQQNCRQNSLLALFPSIHQRLTDPIISLFDEWKSYKRQHPQGLRYARFCQLYDQWLSTSGLTKWPRNRRTVPIAHDDYKVLNAWRSSNHKRKWQRAVALLDLHRHCTMASISRKLERSPKTIKKWRRMFLTQGLASLALPSKKAVNKARQALIAEKKERLVKIIHEPPSLHGVNRTTWTLETLSAAYRKVHGEGVSRSMVSLYFKVLGYKFKKARKVLTSPDPEYRTKLKRITAILSRLGLREKFFSIDEFGPCAVKRRGGRALVPGDVIRTIPQRQRSKGSLICTAALELSTNQVIHFYSKRKNTSEMIKMLEMLVAKYCDQDRIYLSWDAASWHASKAFIERVDAINAQRANPAPLVPRVELAPLPSGAQFLNVIESVFSGMARAVIHNSDYESVNECKLAIDRYFRERNAAFAKNPRRAGNVIWGKEREPPIFSEANNCKDPRYR
jgi:transposase